MLMLPNISRQKALEVRLDPKYYFLAGLLVLYIIQYAFFPSFEKFATLVGLAFLAFIFVNISKPAEIILLISMAYFMNVGDWFTRNFELTEGSGSRILLFDLIIGITLGLCFFKLFREGKFPGFFRAGVLAFLTLFWLMNFIQGMILHEVGYAIGEGRFYFASVFFLAIILFFYDQADFYFKKLLKIISLCSLIIMFYMVLLILAGPSSEGRFNPGNSEVEVLVFGMIICLVDYSRGERNHILKMNPIWLVGIYLIFITVSGVRTMNLAGGGILLYFLYVSPKFSLPQKLIISIAFLVLGAGLLQLEVVRNVVQSQVKYVEVLQGKGDKNADTTFGWRMRMWGICWSTIADDNSRIFLGRPFSYEAIDISELKWNYKEDGKIDNSLVHNDYLAMALTNGVLFVSLLLWMIFSYVFKAFRLAKDHSNWSYFMVVFGWFLCCQLVQSATNAEIKHYGFSITLWMHMGWLAVLFKKYKQEKLVTYGFSKDIGRDPLVQSGNVHRSRYSKYPRPRLPQL